MDVEMEIRAMKRIAGILDDFGDATDSDALARILTWVTARYGNPSVPVSSPGTSAVTEAEEPEGAERFVNLAELIDAAAPRTDADRALVVGYWLTRSNGDGDFRSREVNAELRNFGHRAANITSVFTRLMNRKPALVMQTAKTGTTRQARKRYRLTRAGRDAVERMIDAARGSEA